MSKSIVDLVDELPTDSITVKALDALDYVAPGNWKNLSGFNKSIRVITDETDTDRIKQIRDRALEIYQDEKNGYQQAIWLYQTVDNVDKGIAAAALADKVGDTFRFIPLLDKLTPKSDLTQTVDFSIKLVAEIIASSKIHQHITNPKDFVEIIPKFYQGPSLMRMVGLIALDGVLPLGPDFLSIMNSKINSGEFSVINENPTAQSMAQLIPSEDKQGFIKESFANMQGWLSQMSASVGTNAASIAHRMSGFLEVADDKLDYLAAFLDGTVNYFEHTGIQTVARRLIKVAHRELS